MALLKCPDCSHDVSDSAEKCPHCGAPVRRPKQFRIGIGGGLILVLVVFAVIGSLVDDNGSTSSSSTAAISVPDKSTTTQNKRLEIIRGLQSEGVFGEIRSSSPGFVHLEVRSRFYTLDFKDKQSFVSVAYAYSFDGRNPDDMVILEDVRTGKTIGSFTTKLGLRLD